VAVKKIDISDVQSEEIYNIYREALYLESFRHKNIVKFYHSFIYESNFYSVMEFAKGGELSSYISSEKCLAEKTAKRLFQQLHDAVKYMHSKSVIHRDLKPNNILFLDEKKENLIVIDFGISGFYSGNIKEKIKAGTTRFLPPEVNLM
jgi:serine/threonine protein kinase